MAKAKKTHNVTPALLKLIGGENKLVDVETLEFDPDNPNIHNEKNIQAIKDSLESFGQDQPIVVQKEGMIVRKGNGRLKAATELGWTHVAAVVIDEDNISAMARGVADNRTSELSERDPDLLASVISQLVEHDFADSIGYEEGELLNMLADQDEGPATGDIELPDPVTSEGSHVVFRFGDYKGYISRNTYDKFKELYESKRDENGEVDLDEVIHNWLKLKK